MAFLVMAFVYPRLMRGRDSCHDLLITVSFLLSASAFMLNGPMFPLSSIMRPDIWLMLGSQVLLGISMEIQTMGSFSLGTHGLRDMGREKDAAFTAAFSACILSAVAFG